MNPEFREKHPEALQEYFQIDSKMHHFNDLRIKTKNWSVTVAVTAMGAAFINKAPILFGISAAATCLFWLTEARYTLYQHAFMERQQELEGLFTSRDPSYEGPLIDASVRKFTKKQKSWRFLSAYSVHLPHSILVLASFALMALSISGYI